MKFTVSNPLNSESVEVSEFNMEDMRSVSFMIDNDSDEILHNFLLSKISGDANCISKFIALFKAREQFIGDTIALTNGISNINIQLSYWFDEFIKNLIDIKGVVTIDNFEIHIDYPSSLLHQKYDDILIDMIQRIDMNGNFINFKKLSNDQKIEIIQKIPYNVIREVYNYINKHNYNITIFKERLGVPDIKISVFDNSAFNFIKMLYNYYRYDEIMETVFNISSRISDIGFLMSRNPKDIKLLIKLYSEEVEKMNSEDKSSHD
jgi:hypothetical protein